MHPPKRLRRSTSLIYTPILRIPSFTKLFEVMVDVVGRPFACIVLGWPQRLVTRLLQPVCVYLVTSFASPGCGTLLVIYLLFHQCILY